MNVFEIFENLQKDYEDMSPVKMGDWTFYKDSLTIKNEATHYVVGLEHIDSSGELLDWIAQIMSKQGFDEFNFIKLLFYAIEWNFQGTVQGVFCPSGENISGIKWRK